MAKETTRLKESKLRYIARRSGKPIEELRAMLIMANDRGRRVAVTYEVVKTRKGDKDHAQANR